jgi:hypothetical protein
LDRRDDRDDRPRRVGPGAAVPGVK